MALLDGRRILVTGLLSNRSIAYGVAKAARREGAELAFTYQNERFKERVQDMARELGSDIALPCDVAEDAQIAALFSELGKRWDGLDGLVHAIGFAPREAIAGDFLDGWFESDVVKGAFAFDMGGWIAAGVDLVTVKNDIVRMNTVFKFSLEAWQLYAFASAYAAWYVGRALFRMDSWLPQPREHRGLCAGIAAVARIRIV